MNTTHIEYHVETECGRNMCISACSMEHLMRSLVYSNLRPTRVMLQSEYEAEQDKLREIQNKLKEFDAA